MVKLIYINIYESRKRKLLKLCRCNGRLQTITYYEPLHTTADKFLFFALKADGKLCTEKAERYLSNSDMSGGSNASKKSTGAKKPEQKGEEDRSKIPPVGQSSILTFFCKNGTHSAGTLVPATETREREVGSRSFTSVGMSRDYAIDLDSDAPTDRRGENDCARGITRLEEIAHKTIKAGPWSTELEGRVGQGNEKVGEKRRFREARESGGCETVADGPRGEGGARGKKLENKRQEKAKQGAVSKGKVYVASMNCRGEWVREMRKISMTMREWLFNA
jgi:hypothetical protein